MSLPRATWLLLSLCRSESQSPCPTSLRLLLFHGVPTIVFWVKTRLNCSFFCINSISETGKTDIQHRNSKKYPDIFHKGTLPFQLKIKKKVKHYHIFHSCIIMLMINLENPAGAFTQRVKRRALLGIFK